ncbi:hypothetical protein IHE44_0001759 [Lamprotornis superbus]|uniref:V-SNARE coiled-coil homology domain-containing protein n=1 Tax=Lamprotornis superbus TaxID=245042 RepID=A0A835TTY0_9PASS|nr:hypothetical protein IHE44_0001759 [Lamprotornis superbus]
MGSKYPLPVCAQRQHLHPAPATRAGNSGGERGREAKEQRALINSSKNILSAGWHNSPSRRLWVLCCSLHLKKWLGFEDGFYPTGSPEGLKAEFAELVSELWLGAFLLVGIWGQLTRGGYCQHESAGIFLAAADSLDIPSVQQRSHQAIKSACEIFYIELALGCVQINAQASAQGPSGAAGAAGPPPATNVSSNKRLQQTQAQVDEVVDIMRMNVDKVLERDQKLSELDNRADALQAGASQFETSAAKLKRKYWWKNCKENVLATAVATAVATMGFLSQQHQHKLLLAFGHLQLPPH